MCFVLYDLLKMKIREFCQSQIHAQSGSGNTQSLLKFTVWYARVLKDCMQCSEGASMSSDGDKLFPSSIAPCRKDLEGEKRTIAGRAVEQCQYLNMAWT